jgi:hypothetical protein
LIGRTVYKYFPAALGDLRVQVARALQRVRRRPRARLLRVPLALQSLQRKNKKRESKGVGNVSRLKKTFSKSWAARFQLVSLHALTPPSSSPRPSSYLGELGHSCVLHRPSRVAAAGCRSRRRRRRRRRRPGLPPPPLLSRHHQILREPEAARDDQRVRLPRRPPAV